MKRHWESIAISGMGLLALVLGTIYSMYNTDPHHWGFILGGILDYLHGSKLFSQSYIQYGEGQALFFKLLSPFIPIHYTSIGIVTSLIYSLNLIFLFFCFKKLSHSIYAGVMALAIFAFHSYAIYPWPDYYAGLCLTLSCFVLIDESENEKKENLQVLRVGTLLFLATLFRHTYAIGFLAAGMGYMASCFFNKSLKERKIFRSLLVFISWFGLYLIVLTISGNLKLWYLESIGAASSQYNMGFSSLTALMKNIFLPPKPYLPANLVKASISMVCYLLLGFYGYTVFRKKDAFYSKPEKWGVEIFFIILGFAGFIEAMLGYEVFRIQNACSPLYIASVAILFRKFPTFHWSKSYQKVWIGIGIYFLILLPRFPHGSTLFPLYEGSLSSYASIRVNLFKGHRFDDEMRAYYESLVRLVCDGKSHVVNRTSDSTIPYLCPGQRSFFRLHFYNPPMEKVIQPDEVAQDFAGEYSPNQLIVTDVAIKADRGLKLVEVGIAQRPKVFRFFEKASVIVYRPTLLTEAEHAKLPALPQESSPTSLNRN